ncbi:MAG: DUF2341 domain-containing protein [Candidatus Cyclobacteriaceae bacterium M3_2C_046]
MKKLYLSFSMCAFITYGYSQPCLSDWSYRLPVVIEYFGAEQSDTPVKISISTFNLVNQGKTRFDGADLRVLDAKGNHLGFWITPDTYNTANTTLWINFSLLKPGINKIYLFYGNPVASSASHGEKAFAFYDDFSQTSLNLTKWETCGALPSCTDQQLTFKIDQDQQSMITSKSHFPNDLLLETAVKKVKDTQAFIALGAGIDQSYALTYNTGGGNPTMRMTLAQSNAACLNLIDQKPSVLATDALNITGTWSIAWLEKGKQMIDWPGSTLHPASREDQIYTVASQHQIMLGIMNQAGEMRLDWVRLRKMAGSYNYVIHKEEYVGISAEISSNAPVCEGAQLKLQVSNFKNASFHWTGPDHFSSNQPNPSLSNVKPENSGIYQVVIIGSGNCGSITAQTEVKVFGHTEAGVLSGPTQLCSGNNSGEILLANQVGQVDRWETASSASGPWLTIDYQDQQLKIVNLKTTSYYRAVVKNGICPDQKTSPMSIEISEPTQGGEISGPDQFCFGQSQIQLSLSDYQGQILQWEYSTDTFKTYQEIHHNTRRYTNTDVENNLQFRVKVKNGSCPEVFSSSYYLIPDPLPQVDFDFNPVCQKSAINFINKTQISKGLIVNYIWDFGDGGSAANPQPYYSYPEAGTYLVTLQAISDQGCVDSVTHPVTIYPLPQVNFNYQNGCQHDEILFENESKIQTGQIISYRWTFRDNHSSSRNGSYRFEEAGIFPVILTAVSDKNCMDSISQTVEIYPRNIIDFEAKNVCQGEPAIFKNQTAGNQGISFRWDFGDGNNSQKVHPVHLYKTPGSYQVRLVATSDHMCIDSYTKNVEIFHSPRANFSVKDVCQQDSAQFINLSTFEKTGIKYKWQFGDGNVSDLANPAYQYQKAGIYQVNLTAISPHGCQSDTTHSIMVHNQPFASFQASSVCQGDSIYFNNLSQGEKPLLTYHWELDDSTQSSMEHPVHLYADPGTYSVELSVTSEHGCSDQLHKEILIWPLPQIDFKAANVCDGEAVQFKNLSHKDIREFTWMFGDGTSSLENSPQKYYLNKGSYQVDLLAKTDRNCEAKLSKVVKVAPLPVAEFSFQDVCLNDEAKFMNNSEIDGPFSCTWKFGDGSSSTLWSPVHLFKKDGPHQVTLSVESALGCKDSVDHTIQVFADTFSSISADTVISKGESIQLIASGGVRYLWQPIAGLDNSDISQPIATPLESTDYQVIITDHNNCRVTKRVKIAVKNDYKIQPHNVITPDRNGKNDFWKIWNIENYPDNQVRVYNRWGQLVFQQHSYQNEWYGVSGHDILPDGTYYYLITFEDSPETYTGAINILRNQ